jgi:hypothetical protein
MYEEIATRLIKLERRVRDLETRERPKQLYSAASVNLVAGTSTDTVADLQTLLDGAEYHINEVAATPGINLEVAYSSVVVFNFVLVRAYYSGASTHAVRIQLYNYSSSDYDTINIINTGIDHQQVLSFVPAITNYISSGAATIRFYHAEAGNAAHDLYIDYAALMMI